MSFLSPSRISCILVLFILIFVNFNIKRWQHAAVIDWDVIGYYGYLPATFIHHDYKMNFVKENPKFGEEKKFWPVVTPDGHLIHKMSMGMSVMYSPFFFTAHLHSQIKNSNPNGFSWYYHKYIHLSCLFYLAIGIYFLRKVLLSWFGEWPVAWTLLTIVLSTNLFYYATTEAAMSHAFSFSMSVLLIYCVQNWFLQYKFKYAVGTGICLGLLILIRPVNGLFILFPLLYGLSSWNQISGHLKDLASRFKGLIIAIACCGLVVLPQLLYWKSMTGDFLFFSYVGERFNFLNPHVLAGMLSFRNGWLIYTPVMFLSLWGLYLMYRQKAQARYAILCLLCVYLYVVFSWWCWWYVGFGNRSMIDVYAFLAIPLTAFYDDMLGKQGLKKWSRMALVMVFTALNLFQILQYKRGLIHFDSMTCKAYLSSFGSLKFTDAYKNALSTPDYEKAKN
jgi:hypothetical protein